MAKDKLDEVLHAVSKLQLSVDDLRSRLERVEQTSTNTHKLVVGIATKLLSKPERDEIQVGTDHGGPPSGGAGGGDSGSAVPMDAKGRT